MNAPTHLPLAIEYENQDSLKDVRDNELSHMLAQCADWSALMEDFRGSLMTPAALTLWRVLIEGETATVARTQNWLEAELANRAATTSDDMAPAPGANSRTLDPATGSANGNHHTAAFDAGDSREA